MVRGAEPLELLDGLEVSQIAVSGECCWMQDDCSVCQGFESQRIEV